jgi:hypothetical protein
MFLNKFNFLNFSTADKQEIKELLLILFQLAIITAWTKRDFPKPAGWRAPGVAQRLKRDGP